MAIECLILGKISLSGSFVSDSRLQFTQPKTHIYLCVVYCLGAGQEVGKSCAVVSINGKRIMFDCGMHMGYDDHRRYPDFSLISKSGHFNTALDCVIITHL